MLYYSPFLRGKHHIYVNQFCNVKWNNEISSSFVISNGVGQGKIMAGFAYCFYCKDLNDELSASGFGCTIEGIYGGIFGLSDDDFLLSPTVTGLQKMLDITERYSTSHGLKFSTDPNPAKSKTKCMAWLLSKCELPTLNLCGNPLPWVNKVVHLGNTISNGNNILSDDIKVKNAKYIGRNIELNQEFFFADQSGFIRFVRFDQDWTMHFI